MKKLMAVGCALVSALAVFAEDIPAGHVYMTKSDYWASGSKNISSWNVKGNWSEGAWIEESSCLNVNTNYYVPSECYLWPPNSSPGVWQGGPIVFAGSIVSRVSASSLENLPQLTNATFLAGSHLDVTYRYAGFRSSVITILAPESNPFSCRCNSTDTTARLFRFPNTVFKGDAGTAVRFAVNAGQRDVKCELDACNFAEYEGKVIADGSDVTMSPRSGTSGFEFAGSFVADGATVNGATSVAGWEDFQTAKFGSLDLKNGAAFKFWKASGEIRPFLDVKTGLSIDDSVRVTLGDSVYADFDYATPERVSSNKFLVANVESAGAVCSLPEGPISNFWSSANVSRLATDWSWVVEEDGNGGKNVFVAYTNNVVKTLKGDKTGSNNNTDMNREDTAFGTSHPEEFWSDGKMPDADSTADYVMSYGKILTHVNLPKATLTMRSGSTMYWHGTDVSLCVKELNLVDTGTLYRYGGKSPYTMTISGGRLNLIGSDAQGIYGGQDRGFCILSDITGTKTLTLGSQSAGDKYTSEVSLLGDNSDFHGRLNIAGKMHETADSGALKVYLADARNWGGAFTADEDADRAIVLQNLTQVFVTNDVAFVGENVRNMAVTNSGVMFSVSSGKTLTFGNKITCESEVEIRKSGAGTLEMSGTAALSPSAASAALKINAGTLKVSSRAAVDGLDVSFAAGTKLVVDKDCGFVNTTAANPLAIADEKLSVEIAGFDEKPEDDVEVTVLTLNATASADVGTDQFAFTRTSACKVIRFEKRESGDNVEYVATVGGKKGIVLIVR